jgi:hypothetical protein
LLQWQTGTVELFPSKSVLKSDWTHLLKTHMKS